MAAIKVAKVDKCESCGFRDMAYSPNPACNFEPNFEVAPRKNCLMLSDVSEEDVKKKDDKTLCIFLDKAIVEKEAKPKWCRLISTSITYK